MPAGPQNYTTTQGPDRKEGIPYATNFLMPALEGSLFNLGTVFNTQGIRDPIPLDSGQAVSAIVEFLTQGAVLSQNSYVVLQTDWGDGQWADVAWVTWTGLAPVGGAPVIFPLGMGKDAVNYAFQNTRISGQAPTPAVGSNVIMLGGRFRFVGKATVVAASSSSSSSSSPGPAAVVPGVLVSIRYKILGLR